MTRPFGWHSSSSSYGANDLCLRVGTHETAGAMAECTIARNMRDENGPNKTRVGPDRTDSKLNRPARLSAGPRRPRRPLVWAGAASYHSLNADRSRRAAAQCRPTRALDGADALSIDWRGDRDRAGNGRCGDVVRALSRSAIEGARGRTERGVRQLANAKRHLRFRHRAARYAVVGKRLRRPHGTSRGRPRQPSPRTRAARAALLGLRLPTDSGLPIELWRADGRRVAFIGTDSNAPAAPIALAPAR